MAFNLGVPGLLKFKNTLRAVREGRFEDAAKGMLASKWARQVKGRAVRLAQVMKTGNANS
jgi:lysozyme